jgi:hypothetical protein
MILLAGCPEANFRAADNCEHGLSPTMLEECPKRPVTFIAGRFSLVPALREVPAFHSGLEISAFMRSRV